MRTVAPLCPGKMLEEEFLKPLCLTKYRLTKDIGVPPQRIGDIVAGKRAVTADTDLRLCHYLGMRDGWCLRGQAAHDTAVAREAMGDTLARIQRCALMATQAEVSPASARRVGIHRAVTCINAATSASTRIGLVT